MQTFNKTNLKFVRDQINSALASAGIDGVNIELGNCRYTSNEATFKLIAKTNGALVQEQAMLDAALKREGIESKTGNGYTVVDYHPRKRKYPFIVEGPKGGRWKMTASQVKQRLGA